MVKRVVTACTLYLVRTCGQLSSKRVGWTLHSIDFRLPSLELDGWPVFLEMVVLQPEDKQLVIAVFIAYFVMTGFILWT